MADGSGSQAEGVAALAARLKDDGVVFTPPPGETTEDTLLRFLNARQGNVGKAAAFLRDDAAWRATEAIDELREQDAASVLGCDPAVLQRTLPVSYGAGCDRKGHPLVFKHFGAQCRLKSLLEHTSVQHLTRYNAWLNEQLTLCLRDAGASRWTIVIDALGWHVGLFDTTALRVLKHMSEIDANHYPERLASMIIINAPPMLAGAWRVIRTWLDEATRAKIDFVSAGAPEQARRRLDELAEASQRPQQYGGTGPALADWPTRSGIPTSRRLDLEAAPAPPSEGEAASEG
eukprot:Transcript_1716.p1 GENE.Transcript_1716~~Transcript_1716.p1  ORF type:complete len:326 (-),score=72.68 Transcript_1716:1379-2245(-)